jgi:hypothetical protein
MAGIQLDGSAVAWAMSDRELFIFADTSGLQALAARLRNVGNQAPHILRRAINHTGDKARTKVVRALVKQTGAKYGAVRRALATKRANFSSLAYRIVARGGFMPLKDFSPRQRRDGVSAAPWGRRVVFHQAFISPALGGGVFVRELSHSSEGSGGSGAESANPPRVKRLPIRQLWGPAIPREILKADARAAFMATVEGDLVARAEYELNAVLGGVTPTG